MKKLFFLIFIANLLVARDNPFETSSINKLPEVGVVTEESQDVYLHKESFYLPSNARRLKKVTVEYLSVDGAIRKKELTMNIAVDPHLAISIQQERVVQQASGSVDEEDGGKNTTIFVEGDKTPANTKAKKVQPADSTNLSIVSDEKPKDKQSKEKDDKTSSTAPQEYTPYDFIGFKVTGKSVNMMTRETKIRDFAIPSPNKIAIDFEPVEAFKSTTIKLKDQKYFKAISITSNKEFFRVSLELNGKYTYSVAESDEGYKVVLK